MRPSRPAVGVAVFATGGAKSRAAAWRASLGGVALALLGSCVGSALANPGPYGWVMMHIHEDGGDFCSELPIESCSEIVQVTESTGTLAFDLIVLHHAWWDLDLAAFYELSRNFHFTITWPADWGFVRAEACGSGVTSVVQEGNQATFSIAALYGAPVIGDAHGYLIGLGRLVLNVTSEGRVRRTHDSWQYYPAWSEGRAGVACGNCVPDDCAHYELIRPVIDPPVLELSADQNGTATGQFHVDTDGFENGVDEYTFSHSEAWMTLAIQRVGSISVPIYDVTVHANGAGLARGTYEDWIEVAAPYCLECERVTFTVTDSIPAPALLETWGGVKSRFR